MGRPRVITEERLLRERFNLPKGTWRKDRNGKSTYCSTFTELSRASGLRYRPRFTFDTECSTLNIFYPHSAPEAVDFKLTMRKMEREFRNLLHPKRYLTVIDRDNDIAGRKYTVDYYCVLDKAPDKEIFDKIFSICQDPVTEEP